jgi:Cu(I)/Ag(I) efflux system membrane fusion protein
MNNRMVIVVVALIIGIALGVGGSMLSRPSGLDMKSTDSKQSNDSNEPMYWVAPMDANYRRDGPGKSPMGMDLIAVYAQDNTQEFGEGAVKVAAHVQNNMGMRLGQVTTGQFSHSLSTMARIEVAEDQMTVVSPRIEGWLEKLHVNTTDQNVIRGQALFEIYSPVLVTAQEEFLTALKAKSPMLIESARKRLLSLRVSSTLVQRLEKTLNVEQTVLFSAKQSGVVTHIAMREGSYVTPGMPVMSIAKLDPVWLMAEVFEGSIKGLVLGNDVTVRLVDGSTMDARVDFIHPVLETKTRTLRVRSVLPNPNGLLKPNMFAEAEIHLVDQDSVLLVPTAALIRLGDQDRVVLALDGSNFKSVAVQVGRVGDRFAEVKRGLRDGDRVVTSAQFLLDSESSKSSDFKRMDLIPDAIFHGMPHNMSDRADELIWVQVRVQSIDVAKGILILAHEAIPKWNRPSMTMTMNTSAKLDLSAIQEGEEYDIRFRESSDNTTGFVVEEIVRLLARQGESS